MTVIRIANLEAEVMKVKRAGILFLILAVVCVSLVLGQTFGVKKKAPKPDEFGNVLMDNFSTENRIPGVVFKHWLHRAKFTCRLCHVDLGFGMTAGETEVREADNEFGLYCGACHDGTTAFGRTTTTAKGEVRENCVVCHSNGKEVDFRYDFYEFVRGFPRARFGNRVDWMKAEDEGLIVLEDYLEGVSIRRAELKLPEISEIDAKVYEMPDIIFSHEKHTVWNGCELCHPQIFGVKEGATVYDMQEIFDGKYCGACHGRVAFTNMDCQLCHTKEVF